MLNAAETMEPPVEESERKEEEEKKEETPVDCSDGDKVGRQDGEEGGEEDILKDADESRGAGETREEPAVSSEEDTVADPAAADIPEKPRPVLNLNNEVVKMRKEVKRVRALIIRKLTRQIAALKRKKGKEAEVERNQRRADRLLEEVHNMKSLSPDRVTKTALMKNLIFEEVCKNPKSTMTDRAVARIATHPQFHKKIEAIKSAVQDFKAERVRGGKQSERKAKVKKPPEMETPPSPQNWDEALDEGDEGEEDYATTADVFVESEESDVSEEEAEEIEETEVAVAPKVQEKQEKKLTLEQKRTLLLGSVKSVPKPREVKKAAKHVPARKAVGKDSDAHGDPDDLDHRGSSDSVVEDDESDVDSVGGEGKEYFDDSTEERFHNRSSLSEESEDDDFFLGNVSKFKIRKRRERVIEEEEQEGVRREGRDSTPGGGGAGGKSSSKLQEELDELESRLKSKGTAIQSVFCSSLTSKKDAGGAGRGKVSGKFRGGGKPQGGRHFGKDFGRQVREKAGAAESESEYKKPRWEVKESKPGRKAFPSAHRGRGRGDGQRHTGNRGAGTIPPQAALHPSWEASKKRKEQQGQILPFQGKKIKFDDDD